MHTPICVFTNYDINVTGICTLSFPLDMKLVKDIYSYLHVLEKSQMINLGLVLGLDYNKLKGIFMDSPLFHEELITAWLRKENYVTEDEKRIPTWTNLVAALKDDTVRENGVASLIYKHKGLRFF